MRTRLTIILLILNIVLFGTIIVLDKRVDLSNQADKGNRTVLGTTLVENADAITISARNLEQDWELTKRKDGWVITSPVEWPANFYAVNRILTQLQFLVWESRFPVEDLVDSDQGLENYGLKDPVATVTISSGGKKYSLRIGDGTEIGSRLYVLSPDEQNVLIISRELLESTAIELKNLRSEQIFDIPIFDVRFINMTFNPGNIKLRLAERNRDWRIVTPLDAEADDLKVSSFLNELISLKIMDFQTEATGPTGLEDPPVRLTLEASNRRQTLAVGSPLPDKPHLRYARLEGNPTVFSIPASAFENIRQAQDNLRERRFFPVSERAVRSIEIEDEDHTLSLQRLESNDWAWQVLQRTADGSLQTYNADGEKVRELVKSMNELAAESFVSDAPTSADLNDRYGFEVPRKRITVRQEDERTLLLGGLVPESPLVYAKTIAQDSVYSVRPTILMAASTDANDFREPVLDALATGAVVTSVKVTDLNTGEAIFEESLESEDTTPVGSEALVEDFAKLSQADLARSLARHVRNFKVGRYVNNTFSEESFKVDAESSLPWKYRLDASVTLPGGESGENVTVTYYFTERLSGRTQFGGSDAKNVTFSLKQELIDLLFAITDTPNDPTVKIENTQPLVTPATTEEPSGEE